MSGEILGLSEKGRGTVIGLVSSICHDFSLEQAASLNGLDSVEEAKIMLYMLLAEAGLVEPLEADDV